MFCRLQEKGLGYGGPGPGRKEKEPKERGSFRHRWLPGGIYPTVTRSDRRGQQGGLKTKVEEKSLVGLQKFKQHDRQVRGESCELS